MRHIRSLSVVLISLSCLSLLAAACDGDAGDDTAPDTVTPEETTTTTDAADEASDDTTTTTAAEPTASFRGVTAETIRVGVLAYDWDRLAEIGVEFGVSNNADLFVAALEEINERGGVHGRLLEPVVAEFLPVGSTEADQACVRLTEDEEVFVVVGTALNEQILCFTEINETAAVVAAGMNEERVARANAPYATVQASQETRAADFVALMTEFGVLDDEKVGVIGSVDVSETNYRAIVEAFRDAGHEPVEGLIGGNADDLTESAREQGLIYQRLDGEGVTVAVSTTGVPLEIFNAYDAGYQPEQWLLSTSMTARGLAAEGIPLDYLDGALAVVNTPTGTTAQPLIGDDPLASACVEDLRARTDHPLPYELDAPVNNITTALIACAIADILEAGLLEAGVELTNDSFASGLEAIGGIELPGHLDADLGPGDLGAAKGLTLVRFDAAQGVWEPVDS